MAHKMLFDDGFNDYLIESAELEGRDGIPRLFKQDYIEVPKKLIPFSKAKHCLDKRGFVHFYQHDRFFFEFLNNPKKYLSLLSQFDGVITPDPTMMIGRSRCRLAASTYMNRAIGFYLQRNGIPIIPNIRWGDESTYEFAFLGVQKNSMVCISTVGAIQRDAKTNNYLRNCFKDGLRVMLDRLKPAKVIAYGLMPEDIFGEFINDYEFVRYPSEIELAFKKGER